MTENDQRIAIAQWCRWNNCRCLQGGNVPFGEPDDDYNQDYPNNPHKEQLPDYPHDLNAMVGVLRDKVCGDKELEMRFLKELGLIHERIADSEDVTPVCEWDMVLVVSDCDWLAEALLRTIEKWKD